jgi:hypothetical protein
MAVPCPRVDSTGRSVAADMADSISIERDSNGYHDGRDLSGVCETRGEWSRYRNHFSFQEIRARRTEPFIQKEMPMRDFRKWPAVIDSNPPARAHLESIVENAIVRTGTIIVATRTANGRRSRLEDILIRHRRRRLQAWTYLTAAAAIVAALWAF